MAAPALRGCVSQSSSSVLERGELEEEVLRVAHPGVAPLMRLRGSIRSVGVERAAAVVALVAARLGVAAVRAGALDVAVGQEALGLRVEELLGRACLSM